jgi:hypothetical protein
MILDDPGSGMMRDSGWMRDSGFIRDPGFAIGIRDPGFGILGDSDSG